MWLLVFIVAVGDRNRTGPQKKTVVHLDTKMYFVIWRYFFFGQLIAGIEHSPKKEVVHRAIKMYFVIWRNFKFFLFFLQLGAGIEHVPKKAAVY